MKYFGSIVLACIFQLIHLSFACYGHNVEIVELECGANNNIKVEKDYHVELTKDCKVFVSGYLTIDRPFKTALLSLKGSTSFMNATVFKNKDFCKILSSINVKMECPAVKTGRVFVELENPVDISMEYGPLLPFAVGLVHIAAKVTFDDDEDHPDLFAIVANVTRNDNDVEWYKL